jgi:nicotinamidase/pyrazinamidase
MQSLDRRFFLRFGALGLAAAAVPSSSLFAAGKMNTGSSAALIVVDVQNCFVPGGTLPVGKGDEVVPIINKLGESFDNVVMTQDWHTPGHASFAST